MLLAPVWELYLYLVASHPFFAQPLTLFVVVTNAGVLFYHWLDVSQWGPWDRYKPRSLHPKPDAAGGNPNDARGRVYAPYRTASQWTPFIAWNVFTVLTYAAADLLIGSQTALWFRRGVTVPTAGAAAAVTAAAVNGTTAALSLGAPAPSFVPLTYLMGVSAPELQALSAMAPPTVLRHGVEVALLLVGFDVTQYTFHRLLHTQWLYNTVHYEHHRVQFPYAATIYYTELIDGVCNLLSLSAPSALSWAFFPAAWQAHPLSHVVFLMAVAVMGTAAHSGYDLLWSASYHFSHHVQGTCNYGSLGLCDALAGTYKTFEQIERTNSAYRVKPKAN